MTDAEVKAALTGFLATALTIEGEARGEPVEGKVFVGCVIRNRVQHPRRFGDTYEAVCLARLQFSCWWPQGGAENYAHVMKLARLLVEHDHAESARELRSPSLQEAMFIAEGIIGGQLQDRARGADHYLAKALYRTKPPKWARGQTPVVMVGAHVGFRL